MKLPNCLLQRLLRHPRALLAAMLLLSVLCLPLLGRINLQGDLVDLLPRSSSAAQAFATFNQKLAAGQELIILVTCKDPERLTDFAERYAT